MKGIDNGCSAVHFSAIANFQDCDQNLLVLEFTNHAPVAHSVAPEVA